MDPITAVANAIVAGCEVATEYIKFLQTPVGQKVAETQLKDLEAFKAGIARIGDLVDQAIKAIKK